MPGCQNTCSAPVSLPSGRSRYELHDCVIALLHDAQPTSIARPSSARDQRHDGGMPRAGGVKHQMKPMCQRSVGVGQGAALEAVTTFSTVSRARPPGAPAVRPAAGLGCGDAEVIVGTAAWGGRDRQAPGGKQGDSPTPGGGCMPRPASGSPPVAARRPGGCPHPQAGGSRPNAPR